MEQKIAQTEYFDAVAVDADRFAVFVDVTIFPVAEFGRIAVCIVIQRHIELAVGIIGVLLDGITILVVHGIAGGIEIGDCREPLVAVVIVMDPIFLIVVDCGQSVRVVIGYGVDLPDRIVGPMNGGISVCGDDRVEFVVQIGGAHPLAFPIIFSSESRMAGCHNGGPAVTVKILL